MAEQTDKITVLLVEDNESLRGALRCALEDAGYRVLTADNGHQALQVAENTPFDVVVTDILMPVLDGLELIVELKARNQSCRIIAMTGGGSILINTIGNLNCRHADIFGTHHTLQKPFHPDELINTLEAVLSEDPLPAQPSK
jgi:DNA-binding response OmpR family regulator